MATPQFSELFFLVTDLLDIEAYPALDLACAYPMCWECETVIGAAVDATGLPPDRISFPHALAAATDTITADFPPHQLTWPLATFLLKVLDPHSD